MVERKRLLLLLLLCIYTASAYPVRQTGPPPPIGGWTGFYPITLPDHTGALRTVLYPLTVYNHNLPTQPAIGQNPVSVPAIGQNPVSVSAIGRNPLLRSVSEPLIGQNPQSVNVIGQEMTVFQTPSPPQFKDTPAAPVEETPMVTDPQSQLQPYYPQPYPYYPQPYPYDPLTTQLLTNLETLTPGEQTEIMSRFHIIPAVSQDSQTVFPTWQLSGAVGGAQSQSSSLSSEEEASPPVVYTRMMLPPVVPAYQSQGLSVDPNPEPSALTPDPLPLTPDPGHAHLGNPPTVAPMASGGQGTPKPEVGGAVGVQMKSAVEKGTEGAVGVREGGGVQIKSGGAGDPCPLEKSPPVRETQTSTHSDPRLTHRLTLRQLPTRAERWGRA
uniref:protein FAM186A-like n=1 Tax=Oncorhynchus gorbuscha TaxID=8017 RepID=UPI001EAF5AAA|nr:protein FAM186A-like [Oncorhynchus gorbuscha]